MTSIKVSLKAEGEKMSKEEQKKGDKEAKKKKKMWLKDDGRR